MFNNKNNGEKLDTGLYEKIIGDKVSLIVKLKELRDKVLGEIDISYDELDNLKKQRKEINKKIRKKRRFISRKETEKFNLNKELNRQLRLSNKLNLHYSNEEEVSINSQNFYPENKQKKVEIKSRM